MSKLDTIISDTKVFSEQSSAKVNQIEQDLDRKFKEHSLRLTNIEGASNNSIELDGKLIGTASSIVSNTEFKKILSYFPEEKRNFTI